MTTTTAPERVGGSSESLLTRARQLPRWILALVVVTLWVLAYAVMSGTDTLPLPGLERTDLHDTFTDWRNELIANRDTNVLMQVTGWLSDRFETWATRLQELVAQPAPPRPVPEIGWFGVIALATWTGFALAGWRIAILVSASLAAVGLLGYWEDSMDLLVITFLAVGIALLIGLPTAIWMARSRTVTNVVTPVLDVLQTAPSITYLIPVILFFGIGAPAAVAATVAYATPPVIRIASHGIRSASPTTLEATDSLGQTGWQRMVKVQLPLAKSTIIVGVNQTILAALSMAVIAGFVNGPGLGGPVLRALTALQTGVGFVAGLCIVIVAIMLDRSTTAASVYTEKIARQGGRDRRRHRITLAVSGIGVLIAIYYSRLYSSLAEFPETDLGSTVADRVQQFADWFTSTFDGLTTGFKDLVSAAVLDPLQSLLAESPWYVTGAAILALGFVIGGMKAGIAAVVCLTGIYLTDLWHDAMVTLAMVLVGTILTMMLAMVIGVWMARRPRVDTIVRPILDAAQVMPPFVYLIPVLQLYGITRFSAILAGVIYAAPIAIKLVADGITRVSPSTVEAAESTGANAWQMITRVQIPMARGSIMLAANQGLLYVLSMVVIGGLVGAGALGYDSVLGFSRSEYYGKGVAAGIAIVLMGVMLDRIARGAAERTGADTGPMSRRTITGTGF